MDVTDNQETIYLSGDREAGMYLRLKGPEGRRAWERLIAERPSIDQEIGQQTYWRFDNPTLGDHIVVKQLFERGKEGEQAKLDWLARTTNDFVKTLRPRLQAFVDDNRAIPVD